jgi:hypothetical protein
MAVKLSADFGLVQNVWKRVRLHATSIAWRHDAPCEFARANVVGSTDMSEMKRNAGVGEGRGKGRGREG